MAQKIGILIENRFIEKEIFYYQSYFANAGYDVVLLTRLWGQPELTFKGLEFQAEIRANTSFEDLSDDDLKDYAAIIAPAGYVSDYLLYEEKPGTPSPACRFIERIMKDKNIIKGFICHSLWIAGPICGIFKGRKVTCHNNIYSHVVNAGMDYQDADIFVDDDLITARTGGHHAPFAECIVKNIRKQG
ncbi:MAG: DJ-1/PfpI family protein [Lachnospiraceae bacterium]|nr:DJ-1/PfpI family protein [Lachnospiraceae bacterium]MCR5768659.1 DJ-1/PfpI family protein [Lachnospiraceae bacterium]